MNIKMTKELKPYYLIMPIISIPLCLVLCAVYGWSCLAVITERGGYNGSAYIYYDLSAFQYVSYHLSVMILAIGCIVFQLKYYAAKKPLYLILTFIAFIGLVILSELHIQSRYVGKG
jgi:hypothetical protein